MEEDFFIAGLDGIRENVLGSGVAEDKELCLPFYTGGVDWTNVVVIDEGSYMPGAVGRGVFVCGREGDGWRGGVRGGVCLRRGGFFFLYVGVVAVAFGKDAGQTGFPVEDAADVVRCDLGVAQCGGDGLGHDVFWRVAHSFVEAHDAANGAAR